MSSIFKLNFLLLVYTFIIRSMSINANELYEVVKFKVPHSVWKQALHPTPVLKSPVTIVVPINVQDNDNIDEDGTEEDEAENVIVDATMVTDDVIPEISPVTNPVVLDVIPSAPVAVANPTETVVQDEIVQDEIVQDEIVQQDVPGQVVRFPCSCLDGQCGCCTGAIMERFRMKACGNMTFIPEDFVFDVRLSMNNNTVVRQRVSASDPPPICFNPRRAPFVRVCAEISNISVRNKNAHACLDINADIGGFPVYSASFKCFSFGQSGIKTGQKPKKKVSAGPKPVNLFGNGGQEGEGGFAQTAAETVLNQGGGLLGENGQGLLGGGDGIFGGGEGGIFGDDGDGIFGGGNDDGDDGGPLDAIGDAIGDFIDGRSSN